MKALRSIIGRIGIVAGVAATMLVASCGVTEPEDSAWQDVSRFAWPTSSQMTYVKTVTSGNISTIDTHYVSVVSNAYNGRQMYMLDDKQESLPSRIRFVANRDSLITANERFGGTLPLLAPLDKGHSWVSGRWVSGSGKNQDTVLWHATIIEKFAVLQLDGTQYKNVIGVKYESTEPDGTSQICFRYYAEGIGVIKTVQNTYQSQGQNPINPGAPTLAELQILTSTTAVQN